MNTTTAVLVDGCKFTIKVVEEWGCNLGEDAFLAEEVIDYSRNDVDLQQHDGHSLDNTGGEVDALIDDLQKDWKDSEVSVPEIDGLDFLKDSLNVVPVCENKKHDAMIDSLHNVPVHVNKKHDTLKASLNDVTKDVARLEVPDCIPPSSIMPSDVVPPQQPFGPSPQASNIPTNSSMASNKKRNAGGFKHSSRNLKRVARMLAKDRLEILKILKKQARDQRARFLSHSLKAKRAAKSQGSKTNSDSSISSVNMEWDIGCLYRVETRLQRRMYVVLEV